jgi:hypothetical protein
MMVTLGGIGHVILIIACLAALFEQPTVNKKWCKFAAGGGLTLAHFALIFASPGRARRLPESSAAYDSRNIIDWTPAIRCPNIHFTRTVHLTFNRLLVERRNRIPV